MIKNIISIFFFICLLNGTLSAQNPSYPYGISFKKVFMDYQSQNGGSLTDFNSYHHGFEIGIHKTLSEKLNLVIPVKAGVVRSHQQGPERDYLNCFHKTVYGIDGQLQYQFYNSSSNLVPYVMGGLGAVLEDEGDFNLQVPLGAGLNFKVKDNAYINWQSEYRYGLSENRTNLQHAIGFVYLFGGKNAEMDKANMQDDDIDITDSDGDGLEDDIDLCPQIAGPADLKGCPDRDEDGVPDYRDDCPSLAGLSMFKGCPDTDEDGVSDNDDECPNVPGLKDNKGCPEGQNQGNIKSGDINTTPIVGANGNLDSDGDGIPNAEDKCPNEKGFKSNNGCPEMDGKDSDGDGISDSKDRCPNLKGVASAGGCPDKDGDGVADFDDKCPSSAGPATFDGCPDTDGDGIADNRDKCPSTPGGVGTNGCPEISQSDLTILETAMRAVVFDTGKGSIKPSSYAILNQIGQIMNKYPNYNLIIEGHTDNVGSSVNNQLLSERRSQACYKYLKDQAGIDSSRMSHTGYGESRPISTNDNINGRALNRRVTFNLVPR